MSRGSVLELGGGGVVPTFGTDTPRFGSSRCTSSVGSSVRSSTAGTRKHVPGQVAAVTRRQEQASISAWLSSQGDDLGSATDFVMDHSLTEHEARAASRRREKSRRRRRDEVSSLVTFSESGSDGVTHAMTAEPAAQEPEDGGQRKSRKYFGWLRSPRQPRAAGGGPGNGGSSASSSRYTTEAPPGGQQPGTGGQQPGTASRLPRPLQWLRAAFTSPEKISAAPEEPEELS